MWLKKIFKSTATNPRDQSLKLCFQQFHGKLDETKEGLSSDSLEGVRKQGENVQRKMIEVGK